MRYLNKISLILILIFSIMLFYACHIGRFVVYNYANQSDYKKFPSHQVARGKSNFSFVSFSEDRKNSAIYSVFGENSFEGFNKRLEESETAALLIVKNDTLFCEWYHKRKDSTSIFTSFSMAKSFVSMLIGIAVDEGLIKSLDDPITNYIDGFKNEGFDKITIEHVLRMETGIKYDENYNSPFGNVAKAYYGRNLKDHLRSVEVSEPSGEHYEYVSIATQILGEILAKATGRNLAAYMEEKVWQRLGMEYDASWSLDKKNGQEKAFCCLNARARDFARIGRLFLNRGNWDGEQIVSSEWVDRCTRLAPDAKNRLYGLHWWLNTPMNSREALVDYFALGHLGQYLYISPANNMVMLRIGYDYGNVSWQNTFKEIALVL